MADVISLKELCEKRFGEDNAAIVISRAEWLALKNAHPGQVPDMSIEKITEEWENIEMARYTEAMRLYYEKYPERQGI